MYNGMKKILSVFITAALLMTSFTAAYCENDIVVLLDGREIEFDVPPQIINDRTLVPMRAIFEALGADVSWDGDRKSITAVKDDITIKMAIGSEEMYIGSSYITLDAPPQIIDDRTLVPARAVAESFDCDVLWEDDTRSVIISSHKSDISDDTSDNTSSDTSEDISENNSDTLEYPIEYDDTVERSAHYVRDFKITDITKNSAGNYEIKYTLRTFLEGRGTVTVSFRCLDESGQEIDTFGGAFVGTDYTWSYHNSEAVISGRTAKIELILNQ